MCPLALDLATGMRLGELLALRVNDIDLGRGRLHVRQAMRQKREEVFGDGAVQDEAQSAHRRAARVGRRAC